jgi:hypothetical protein
LFPFFLMSLRSLSRPTRLVLPPLRLAGLLAW